MSNEPSSRDSISRKERANMELWRKNKKLIAITSLIALLPMVAGVLLWKELPNTIATHFGFGNVPNGWSGKEAAVFGIPLFCLIAHLLCAFAVPSQPKGKNMNGKAYKMLLLLCPGASLVCGVSIYGYALSWNVNIEMCVKVFLVCVLLFVGYSCFASVYRK